MATALLNPLFATHNSFLPNSPFLRKQSGFLVRHGRKCESRSKIMACSNTTSIKPRLQDGVFFRRDLILIGFSTSLSFLVPSSDSVAEEEVKMDSFTDDINAYSYLYPLQLPSKKFVFKWVESRKPERYSSAAPLSPNARLRIVSERVDIIDNLIISVTVSPPNIQILKSKDKNAWNARDVADCVLSDKSALRVTSTQRLAESSVLDAHSSDIDGQKYWYYEYLVRKSPTRTAQEGNLYRHYVASTSERDGYLYSLSASTLSKQWDAMGPFLQKAVESFRLVPPTQNYVPPFKDPWRFW